MAGGGTIGDCNLFVKVAGHLVFARAGNAVFVGLHATEVDETHSKPVRPKRHTTCRCTRAIMSRAANASSTSYFKCCIQNAFFFVNKQRQVIILSWYRYALQHGTRLLTYIWEPIRIQSFQLNCLCGQLELGCFGHADTQRLISRREQPTKRTNAAKESYQID